MNRGGYLEGEINTTRFCNAIKISYMSKNLLIIIHGPQGSDKI